jgi:hypothetical protein
MADMRGVTRRASKVELIFHRDEQGFEYDEARA